MNDILKKINVWHIVGWILYTCYTWYDMIFKTGFDIEFFPLDASNLIVEIIVFYIFYFWIWKKKLSSNQRWSIVLWIILGVGIFIVIRYLVQEQLFLLLFGYDNYNDELGLWFYVRDNIPRGILPVIASLVVFLAENRWIPEHENLKLQNELKETELSFLRSQINPHFLFNTLNFIYSRAFALDEKLAEGVRKLSDILRYAVDNSTSEKRLLNDEIELLKNFISIHELRFENNCYVEFEVISNTNGFLIEPLLLLPFVENAFKHGIYDDLNYPIMVSLKMDENSMLFKCENRINRANKDSTSGIGLENIKRRLQLQYPGKHELQLKNEKDMYSVSLQISL